MKLTKLYIHNYKSFYDTTIELDKMNIVVGENNSGKSNLIDVLEFIQIYLEKGSEKALVSKGGFEKILNYKNNEELIVIEFYLTSNHFIKKTKITINKNVKLYSTIIWNEQGETFFLSSYRERDSFRRKEKSWLTKNKNHNIREYDFMKLIPASNITMTYTFNTETIRNQSHKKFINELERDGSNLGKNLFNIKNNYPNTFELISNSMIGIVNEIDGIDVQETFGNYLIGFHEQSEQIGIHMVSDGTINLLATITALNQEDDKSILLAFDEPERYLHIKAVNYLMTAFRDSEKQILITTHSTEILKYADIEEIIFIYRDSDGDTQSIRADEIPDLKGKMERLGYDRPLTLDELIGDRTIGDFE